MAQHDALGLAGWSDLPDEEDIIRTLGATTFDRGARYAMEGRVRWLHSDPLARRVHAAVEGSRSTAYQTVVRVGT